jgi:diguanylate cyclase (GGDEF)-like protein
MSENMTIDMNHNATMVAQFSGSGTTTSPRTRGLLIQMSGQDAGRIHCLTEEVITIGRGKKCLLYFDDTTLSRTHAIIRLIDGEFVLEDAGSLNGCFINRQRITAHALRHGDRLRLGSGLRVQFQLVNLEEEQVLVHLYEAAVRDGLTKLFNRRCFDERLKVDMAHSLRHKRELVAMIIDVDFFKRVNDTHGHLAGDEVLRVIAGLLADSVRSEDMVARYGGEEFVVLTRDVAEDGAACLAERLRKGIEAVEVHFEDLKIKVTASIGIAALSLVKGEKTGEALLAMADKALYQAKEGGRNKVVTSS